MAFDERCTSILVTTFNHSKYIGKSLTSILSVMSDNTQVIVVDDGSVDNTFKLAREIDDSRFFVFTKENEGPSSTLNYGIERCDGDVVVLFSGDDVMLPVTISERVQTLDQTMSDILSSVPIWIDSDGIPLLPGSYPDQFWYSGGPDSLDFFRELYYRRNFICAPSVLIRKSLLKDIGPFKRDIWQLQDYDYWLRAAAQGAKFFITNEPYVAYRWHGGNLSSRNKTRAEWELDVILSTATDNLNQEAANRLLFGEVDQSAYSPLDVKQARLLLALKHSRPIISAAAAQELRKIDLDLASRNSLIEQLY